MTEPEALVRSFYRAFEEGDLDGAMALLAPDIDWTFQGPPEIPYTGRFVGLDEVRRFFTAIGEHVEAIEFSVDEVLTCGERVVAIGHEEMRVKSTGRTFTMGWADVYTIQNGRITKFAEYTDTGAMLQAYLDL